MVILLLENKSLTNISNTRWHYVMKYQMALRDELKYCNVNFCPSLILLLPNPQPFLLQSPQLFLPQSPQPFLLQSHPKLSHDLHHVKSYSLNCCYSHVPRPFFVYIDAF